MKLNSMKTAVGGSKIKKVLGCSITVVLGCSITSFAYVKKNDNFYYPGDSDSVVALGAVKDSSRQGAKLQPVAENNNKGDDDVEAFFGITPRDTKLAIRPEEEKFDVVKAPFLKELSQPQQFRSVLAGDMLEYSNWATPRTVNFDKSGLYTAIDGAILKFNDLHNRNSTYDEVAWNCGGSFSQQQEKGIRRGFTDRDSPGMHPRWAGGFTLGPASATDNKITAYTSTYGDGDGVYRNYRIDNGSDVISEKVNFRTSANDVPKNKFTGGAIADAQGTYWRYSGTFGKDVSFFSQDQVTGSFTQYSGIKSIIAGDTVWNDARVAASFEFDAENNIYILALSSSADNELWLYKLSTEDPQNIKAVNRKRITGVLSSKDVLFKGNYSRVNGLAWWNGSWWVMRQDVKDSGTNNNHNPDAALYRVDPATGASEEWFRGMTLHPGKESCWDRSWVGGVASAEQMPKNPGSKLDIAIEADKAVAKRKEGVRYTVTVKNVGWESYAGNVDIDFSGVLENALAPTQASASSGETEWSPGQLNWVGTVAAGETLTIKFEGEGIVIKDTAADGEMIAVKVSSGGISNCVKDSPDNDGACEASVRIDAPAFLQITREPLEAVLKRDQTQTNIITVKNIGGARWTGSIRDEFTGLSNVVLGQPSATVGTAENHTMYINWAGTLLADQETTIRYSVTVGKDAPDGRTFTATFYSGINVPSNCSLVDLLPCTAKITVESSPMLKIKKIYQNEILGSGVLRYQITAENTGGAAYSGDIVDDLSDVLLKASFRDETASAQVDGNQRGVLTKIGNRLIWNADGVSEIRQGETLTISYEVYINPERVFR